jgi:Kunitz/Bovine pancreatic trypsin inhibitor domain
VLCREKEERAETSPSSGSLTLNMVAAQGFGMVAARVTTTDLNQKMSAKTHASRRLVEVCFALFYFVCVKKNTKYFCTFASTCVASSLHDYCILDACFLPKISGPCEGYKPTWHYDSERKACTQFVYGGCLGNNNKFETREECQQLCAHQELRGRKESEMNLF